MSDVEVPAVDCTDGAPEVAGSHLLLAVGRRPNTDDLGSARSLIVWCTESQHKIEPDPAEMAARYGA